MLLNRTIAWICFILSQGTIAISYLISLQYDHPKVLSCNPFFQGCLNITDAGIYSPEGFIFRGGMIAACAFFIMWWLISFEYIHGQQKRFSKLNVSSTALGIIGAILLIIATAVLVPPREDINWTVHVAGATLFFLVTFAAQAMHYFMCRTQAFITDKSNKLKLINVATQACMIALFFILDNTNSGDMGDAINNAIEWWLALFIALYFFNVHFRLERHFKLTSRLNENLYLPKIKNANILHMLAFQTADKALPPKKSVFISASDIFMSA